MPLSIAVCSRAHRRAPAGGDASNIIPEEVKIVGTIRTTSMDMMRRIQGIMRDRVEGVAGANGCTASVTFHEGEEFTNSRGEKYVKTTYPPLVNDRSLFQMGLHTAVELFKKEDGSSLMSDIVEDEDFSLGGEDYAFFSEKVPSCMYMIGHQDPNDPATSNNHHQPKFQVDEAMLARGAAFYAMLALDFLASQ